MVYIVRSLDYSIKYYDARATHALHMFTGFVMILVHKANITLQLC